MDDTQRQRIKDLASKPKLTKEEWKEYEDLVRLQYETGENNPMPVVEDKNDELPN